MNTNRLFFPDNNRISLAIVVEQDASSQPLASSDALASVRADLTNVPEKINIRVAIISLGFRREEHALLS